MAKLLQNYQPVTDEQLKNPADGEWPMVRRTYDGWGYSPLDQITARNVRGLQPVWVMSTGMNNGQEAAPIVSGGVMFVSTSYNQVMAIDAKAGDVALALSKPDAGQCQRKTRQSRRCTLRRQGVLRVRRGDARVARREDR